MAAKTTAQRNQHNWVWLTRWAIRPMIYHLYNSLNFKSSHYMSWNTCTKIKRPIALLRLLEEALDKDYAAYSLKLKEEKKSGIKQPKH